MPAIPSAIPFVHALTSAGRTLIVTRTKTPTYNASRFSSSNALAAEAPHATELVATAAYAASAAATIQAERDGRARGRRRVATPAAITHQTTIPAAPRP